jgi:hypothetical protein
MKIFHLFKQADDFSHTCAKNAQGPDQFGLLLVAIPSPGYQGTLMATSKTWGKNFRSEPETGLKDGANLHTANIHEKKKSKQKHQSKALL